MQNRLYLIGGWIAIVLSLFVWLLTFYIFHVQGGKSFHEIGPLGDWVTGITAPFLNIAGFFMIYAAFRRQGADAEQARGEFHLQRFETTFFHLIQLHHQNVHTIQSSYTKKAQEDFFEAAFRYLQRRYSSTDNSEQIRIIYADYYTQSHNYIDHFVRHLLFTFKYVMETTAFGKDIRKEVELERKRYLGILLGQISTEELLLLFYHTLCDPTGHAATERKKLFQANFFDRLKSSKLILDPNHWTAYQQFNSPK